MGKTWKDSKERRKERKIQNFYRDDDENPKIRKERKEKIHKNAHHDFLKYYTVE